MKILTCIDCKEPFEAIRKDTLRCPVCKKKHASYKTMKSRKKYHPEIEMGVGSGNGFKNKHQPISINTYRKHVDTKCAWCDATDNLLVHHIDGNRQNNDLTNLVTLCKRCHQTHHCKRNITTGRYEPK